MSGDDKRYPGVGVAVIVVKEGKVLVCKRGNTHGSGTWAVPGGKLEFGETWEECARREVQEEAAIKVKNLSFVYATNDIMPGDSKHYVTIYMIGEYAGGEVHANEPEKNNEFQWLEWENIPQPRFIPLENLFKAGYKPI